MFLKKYLYLILLCATSVNLLRADSSKELSADEASCLRDASCKCYCSGICKFRDKNESDKPVWVKNDPNGKFCYCKQWDLDEFENRKCDKEIWDI